MFKTHDQKNGFFLYHYVSFSQLGKADTFSHKFRRKSKVKETKSGETTSARNMACSPFSSSSDVTFEEDNYLGNLRDRGDKELKKLTLSSELLDSESLTELHLAGKLSNCRRPAPALFADNNTEGFHSPQPAAASAASDVSLAAALLEETTEHMRSDLTELCSNETMSVSSYKIWKDDCLLLVWLVSDKSGSELKSVNLEIAPAENFKVRQRMVHYFHLKCSVLSVPAVGSSDGLCISFTFFLPL